MAKTAENAATQKVDHALITERRLERERLLQEFAESLYAASEGALCRYKDSPSIKAYRNFVAAYNRAQKKEVRK